MTTSIREIFVDISLDSLAESLGEKEKITPTPANHRNFSSCSRTEAYCGGKEYSKYV
jgi:hypothetical protein